MQKFSKVFTLMVAMLALAYCAVSCKVNVDDEPTLYTVTVASSIEHGKVSVDKSSAGAGTTIKLTATADEGYQLDSYSVKDASSNAITVTDGTFTMPKSNVTVSATFKATAVTPQKTAGSISYATTTVEKTTADGAFTNELTKTGDGTVSYSSSDANVATVNATTGEVTIVGAGTATITATVTDSDTYTYASKTASYTVSVTVTVQSETLLTTITGAGSNTNPATSANISYSTEGVATLTFSGSVNYNVSWGWWGRSCSATVAPADGYTITKCVFYDNNDHSATDIEAPFVVETDANKIPQVNDTPIDSQSKGITKIEVYGYVNP